MNTMDQQLKERLVGAGVLVFVGILVIPLLLDGPPPDQPVEVGLELPAADGDQRSHTIRLDVPARRPATPASGTITRVSEPPEADKSQPRPPPETKKEKSAKPARLAVAQPEEKTSVENTSPRSSTRPADPRSAKAPAPGGWVVQVGSFSNKANATRLADSLRSKGFDVFVSQTDGGSTLMHRVRVGPVGDKSAAQVLADSLAESGQAGRVIPNDG
jgi:DedD protein